MQGAQPELVSGAAQAYPVQAHEALFAPPTTFRDAPDVPAPRSPSPLATPLHASHFAYAAGKQGTREAMLESRVRALEDHLTYLYANFDIVPRLQHGEDVRVDEPKGRPAALRAAPLRAGSECV